MVIVGFNVRYALELLPKVLESLAEGDYSRLCFFTSSFFTPEECDVYSCRLMNRNFAEGARGVYDSDL